MQKSLKFPVEITTEQFENLVNVAFVAKGHDLDPVAYVHLKMPSVDQLRVYDDWARGADFIVSASDISLEQVGTKWPGVRTLSFGCTCCCTDDLVEWNECSSCGAIFEDEHADGCPNRSTTA